MRQTQKGSETAFQPGVKLLYCFVQAAGRNETVLEYIYIYSVFFVAVTF